MSTLRAACAAVLLAVCAPAAPADARLTLDAAIERVLSSHPDLQALGHAEAARAAAIERAGQAPPLAVGVALENALGSGEAAGLKGVEASLSLASVFERAERRAARVGLAELEREGIDHERRIRRLDLAAEVARRYLDALAARTLSALAGDELRLREQVLAVAQRRARSGAAPAAEALTAEAARLRVAGELARAEGMEQHARRRLAVLWGEPEADVALAEVALSELPVVPAYATLRLQLKDTPEIARYGHEARLREARVQLARSESLADLQWEVGVRRLEASDDWGLVGSVSIPLGSAQRAGPAIRGAEAELVAIELEREGTTRALEATLSEAWARLDLAVVSARRIDAELLPALEAAAQAAGKAYAAGAASQLDWAQLLAEIASVGRERVDASLDAHRARIEIERLTGQVLATTKESTP
jgi:cobalt-zinc-cadmium efflux system outer membrane protein